MRKLLMIFATLSLTACASKQVIVTIPPANCANLVPPAWALGVPAAPIPTDAPVTLGAPLTEAMRADIVRPWAIAYAAMSGALEIANGRTRDAMDIQRQCEQKANAARLDRR